MLVDVSGFLRPVEKGLFGDKLLQHACGKRTLLVGVKVYYENIVALQLIQAFVDISFRTNITLPTPPPTHTRHTKTNLRAFTGRLLSSTHKAGSPLLTNTLSELRRFLREWAPVLKRKTSERSEKHWVSATSWQDLRIWACGAHKAAILLIPIRLHHGKG